MNLRSNFENEHSVAHVIERMKGALRTVRQTLGDDATCQLNTRKADFFLEGMLEICGQGIIWIRIR